MALRALQSGVFALQGIRTSRMLLQPEFGGLKSLNAVTGRALLAAHASCELSLMLISVTVRALLECEGLFEIALAMAGDAIHLLVFSQQWVLRPGMIKAVVECRG